MKRIKFDYPPLFEMFWGFYPRKIEKRNCFESWKILSFKTKQQIVVAAKNYAEAMKLEGREDQFIKYPKVFMNPKKCLWEDYLKPPKKEKSWLENKMEEEKNEKKK